MSPRSPTAGPPHLTAAALGVLVFCLLAGCRTRGDLNLQDVVPPLAACSATPDLPGITFAPLRADAGVDVSPRELSIIDASLRNAVGTCGFHSLEEGGVEVRPVLERYRLESLMPSWAFTTHILLFILPLGGVLDGALILGGMTLVEQQAELVLRLELRWDGETRRVLWESWNRRAPVNIYNLGERDGAWFFEPRLILEPAVRRAATRLEDNLRRLPPEPWQRQ